MKFLLDVNITPLLGNLLQHNGHSFRHASEMLSGKMKDDAILSLAKVNDEIVITHVILVSCLLLITITNLPLSCSEFTK